MIYKHKRADLLEIMRKYLTDAHEQRKQRPEPQEWWRFEMEQMLGHVNWHRAMHDKEPLPMRKLLRRESVASGHIDYALKFSLYCTELVLEEP